MRILSVDDVGELVRHHELEKCLVELAGQLKCDFARWHEFTKMPRPAMHVPGGVIELMPICDAEYYSFKYVAGAYPENPSRGKLSVVATGQLSRVVDGYPLLSSEMTLLTAMRTAATSALATDLMARQDAKVLALIGTGAQSEFQVRAAQQVRDIAEVHYFDIDAEAMKKFARNLNQTGLRLVASKSAEEAVRGADIVTVCTACKKHAEVIKDEWVSPGMHLNALGGDCSGKTELEKSIVPRAKVVVEYFDQSWIEGEIQRFSKEEARELVHAELYQLVTGEKEGRTSADEITLFDSVGIALEDYSALRWIYDLAQRSGTGEERELVPSLKNPKNLFELVKEK